MSAYKIFISSPGDVGRERHLAEQVIRRVAAQFQERVEVEPYFWEYEPMESTRDYQENIPLTSDFDLVICILWKRLGSPLSVKHERPDGGRWRSGTEFELMTAVESKKARGAPDIFIFKNDTKPTFEADEEGDGAKTELDLAQWKALIAFIKEWCEGVQDGQRVFTAALNRYQALDQFEQVLEKLLVGKLNERFPPVLDPSDSERTGLRPAAPTWTQGSPFRGLEAFQFLHAAVFCGRTHAIGEVLDRLRRKAARGRPFVLILGASGSGKSSLAMAGVLPLLIKPGTIEGVGLWRRVVFRPGGQTEVGDLFDRLAAALVRRQQEGEGLPELISGSTTVERLAADLRADPKAAALLVRSALDQVAVLYREAEAQKLRGWMAESQTENRMADVERYGRLLAELTPREARLALVIDQAEELFTSDDLNRRPELRTGFAVALDALAASGFVLVLATLRSDFYSQIQQLPAFVDLKEADGQFDLLPAQPAEIAQMIRQPALAAGLRFEQDRQTQEGLDEVLADQVKAEPRLLPLLEFALDELYKQRSADGLLTFEAYRVHLDGSIVRALAKRADATLEGLPELSRDAFRSVMRRLATTVDDRAAGSAKGPLDVIQKGSIGPAFQRQRVPYDQLTAHPPGAKALVDAFVAARLLVVETGKADDQKAEVTVAHEALFEHWAALKNLLLAERDDLILPRARVGASHELWRAENRAGDFLLPPGKQLSEAEQLLAEYGEELTPELKAYIAASMAQAHAQQKRRQRLLISALIVFALLAVGASGAAIFGFWQKGEAERQARLASENARIANEQKEEVKRTSAQADFDLAVLYREKAGEVDPKTIAHLARALRTEPNTPLPRQYLISFLRDKSRFLPLTEPISYDAGVAAANFSMDGQRVVTLSKAGTMREWDAESGKVIGELKYHDAETLAQRLVSADGRYVLAVSQDSTGQTGQAWNVQSGQPVGKPMRYKRDADSVESFSTDGRRVLVVNYKTARVWDVQSGKPLGEPMQHGLEIRVANFSADGRRVLTASEDNTARLWDAESGRQVGEPMHHNDFVLGASFSPDGRRVLTNSRDKTARVWDAESGKPVSEPMRDDDGVQASRFSADGARVLTVSWGKTARVWDADTGKLVGEPMRHETEVETASFSLDRRWVLTVSKDNTVGVWDAESGKPVSKLRSGSPITKANFSADGQFVATASEDKTARVWDAKSGKSVGEPMFHEAEVLEASFSANGRRVLTLSRDNVARLWYAQTGQPVDELKDRILKASFSTDGARVLTVSGDNTAQVWDARSGKPVGKSMRHETEVLTASFSADGARVLTVSGENTAQVWDAQSGKPVGEPMRHETEVVTASFSLDRRRVLTISKDNAVRVWDAESGKPIGAPMHHNDFVLTASFSADRQRVVTVSGKIAQVWDAESGKPIGAPMQHEGWISTVRFSPNGQRVLTTSLFDYTARLWDAQNGKTVGEVVRGFAENETASFSADGRWMLTASIDWTIPGQQGKAGAQVWDAQSGDRIGEPMRHDAAVLMARFSADGARVLTVSGDNTAQVWDARSGKPVGEPMRHENTVELASFSSDGRRVLTASRDKIAHMQDMPSTARVWDAESGRPVGEPMHHEGWIHAASFSADGKRVLTASDDKTVRLWDSQSGKPVGEPMWHDGAVLAASFSADGRRVITSEYKTAQVWDIAVNLDSPLPSWVPELAEALVGQRLNEDGLLVPPKKSIVELRQELLALRGDDFWSRFGRWFFMRGPERTISPDSNLTVGELERLLAKAAKKKNTEGTQDPLATPEP